MRTISYKFIYFIAVLLFSPVCLASLTLQDVLNANPEIADFTPSEFAFHVSEDQSVRTIKGEKWELRYFTFTDGKKQLADMPFKTLISQKKLQDMKIKSMPVNPYLMIGMFAQPEALSKDGIYFTLSLRKIDE